MTFGDLGAFELQANTEICEKPLLGVIIWWNLELLVQRLKPTIPVRWKKPRNIIFFDKVILLKDAYEALVDADALLLVTWMVWIPDSKLGCG